MWYIELIRFFVVGIDGTIIREDVHLKDKGVQVGVEHANKRIQVDIEHNLSMFKLSEIAIVY